MSQPEAGALARLDVQALTSADAEAFLALVDAHADFEGMPRPTPDARERLVAHALMDPPLQRSYVGRLGGEIVGYAIVFLAYSSFLARPTFFIEDLFIRQEDRGRGLGQAFLEALKSEARRLECGRIEWMVQHWNEAAIRFYAKQGAYPLSDWRPWRMDPE